MCYVFKTRKRGSKLKQRSWTHEKKSEEEHRDFLEDFQSSKWCKLKYKLLLKIL